MRLLLLPFLWLACSENSAGLPDGAADVGAADVGVAIDAAPRDASEIDAAPIADAGAQDADTEDADIEDAEIADADQDAAAEDVDVDGGGCGGLGIPCSGEDDCDPQYDCTMNLCLPPGRPECGGVVGVMCPPVLPECTYYTGADFGPCFTATELACVCATAEGRAAFVCP